MADRWTPALFLSVAATLLFSVAFATPPSEYHLWLGDEFVDDLPPARSGLHFGPQLSVGGVAVQATWDSTSPRPALMGEARDPLPPMLPSRRELAIVTTEELAMNSRVLWRFMDFRRAEGWQVVLMTEAEWDHPTADGPDDRAFRIRAALADRYAEDPGAYLLLIGDPDPEHGDIPMVFSRPMETWYDWYDEWLAEEFERIPTDLIYSDLDSSWDCDGDGRYAEYPDDRDCTDFGPELYVGRLPIYDGDAADLDVLLTRLLARDMESSTAYRLDTLFPAALFGMDGSAAATGGEYEENDDGACIVDAIAAQLPDAFQAGVTRLYEDTGLITSDYEHEGGLSRDEVVDRWNDGRGIVVWCGHGGPNGAYRAYWEGDLDGNGGLDDHECRYPPFLESNDVPALESAHGAFTWHVSCDNGYPEIEDNIGAELLYGGAVATATASRPAMGVTVPWGDTFEPRPDLGTSSTCGYYYALSLADGYTAGEALSWTKYALPGDGWIDENPGYDLTGAAWLTRFEFNLYGDPTRSLELCETTADCDDGSPCNGTETCSAVGVCERQGPEVDCSALDDDCSIGRCAADTGQCVAEPRLDFSPCDDGNWCTEYDSCQAGVCGGPERECGSRDGYDVYCDEPLQTCVFEELIDADEGTACSSCAQANDRRGVAPALLLLLLLTTSRRVRRHGTDR
jgi:hypothetical protein